jgi:hypothetical protein
MAAFTLVLIALALGLYLGALWERRSRKTVEESQARIAERREASRRKPEWLKSTQPQPGTAGFTIAAALNGVGCLGRCRADEPVFVLCARDKAASMAVRDWAALAERLGAGREKIADARDMADRMEQWREASGGGKIPD